MSQNRFRSSSSSRASARLPRRNGAEQFRHARRGHSYTPTCCCRRGWSAPRPAAPRHRANDSFASGSCRHSRNRRSTDRPATPTRSSNIGFRKRQESGGKLRNPVLSLSKGLHAIQCTELLLSRPLRAAKWQRLPTGASARADATFATFGEADTAVPRARDHARGKAEERQCGPWRGG